MSAKNWLERDLSQSPGLQRIREAQQDAALAKAQEAQRAREAEIAAREAERRRAEMLARIEQKTAQVLPLLEEIRDFANRTGTYPLGESGRPSLRLERGNPQLVFQASISRTKREILPKKQVSPLGIIPDPKSVKVIEDIEERINLQYGFLGTTLEKTWIGHGDDIRQEWTTVLAAVNYGVSLKIKGTSGEIELLRQRIVEVPAKRMPKGGAILEHKEIVDDWKILPTDETSKKSILSEAFHDPALLGYSDLPTVLSIDGDPKGGSTEADNFSLVKVISGFLGHK